METLKKMQGRIKNGEYDVTRGIKSAWQAYKNTGLRVGIQYSRLRRGFNYFCRQAGYEFQVAPKLS